MAGTLIAIASGPAILCLYLTYKARMPEAFPHWVLISNGFLLSVSFGNFCWW